MTPTSRSKAAPKAACPLALAPCGETPAVGLPGAAGVECARWRLWAPAQARAPARLHGGARLHDAHEPLQGGAQGGVPLRRAIMSLMWKQVLAGRDAEASAAALFILTPSTMLSMISASVSDHGGDLRRLFKLSSSRRPALRPVARKQTAGASRPRCRGERCRSLHPYALHDAIDDIRKCQ